MSNNKPLKSLSSIPTYVHEGDFANMTSGCRKSISYFNFMSLDIDIAERTGVVCRLTSDQGREYRELESKHSNKFLILIEYDFSRRQAISTLAQLDVGTHPPGSLADRLKRSLSDQTRDTSYGLDRIKTQVLLSISYNDFADNDFAVYIPELDSIVSIPSYCGIVSHPCASNNSLISFQNNAVQTAKDIKEGVLVVKYVNSKHIGSKIFMTFGNEVLMFTATAGDDLADGIYFLQYQPVEGLEVPGMQYCITPDLYEKYGFFRTREEALTKGESKSIKQIENEERKLFLNGRELDNKEKALDNAAVRTEEAIIEKFEKVIEKVTDQKKQNREHFLGVLKQTGEILKVAAPFITLVISLRAAFK